jgi:hypothetical protein
MARRSGDDGSTTTAGVPPITRRAVFRLSAGAGLVVAVPLGASGAAAARRSVVPTGSARLLPIPGRSAFLPGVGTAFSAVGDAGRFDLRLHEVLDLPGAAATATDREQSFNLIFQPVGPALPDGIYRIRSSRVPEATLSLSHVDRLPGRRLQALINRSGAA